MKFYEEKMKAFSAMNKIIKNSGKQGVTFDTLVYNLELLYPVGETTIQKRLNRMESVGAIKIEGKIITWVE